MNSCCVCGAPTPQAGPCSPVCRGVVAMQSALKPPDEIPDVPGYDIGEKLGGGGFGNVYVAVRHSDNALVALKVLRVRPQKPEDHALFAQEAKALRTARSEFIPRLIEDGLNNDPPFLAMEYVQDAVPFSKYHAATPRQQLQLVIAITQVIQSAHTRGTFHNDLKPSNVLIDKFGRPYIVDFGAAHLTTMARDLFAKQHTGMGTPGYTAPEVMSGAYGDAASDVYSLGGLIIFAWTGREPGESGIVLPRGLRKVVERCQHLDPSKRYQSVIEVANDLGNWLANKPTIAEEAGPTRLVELWAYRNWALTLAFSLLVVLLGFVGQQAVSNNARRQAEATAQLVSTADAAFNRGRWSEAHDNYTAALTRNPVDRSRLVVARLRCELRLNQFEQLEAAIQRELANPALADRRAELYLLQADLLLSDQDRLDDGYRSAEQTLSCDAPLSAADRAYTEGLLANNPTKSFDYYRQALAADPSHYPAHAGLVAGLTVIGKRQDAYQAADVMRRTFPTDPLPDLSDAINSLALANVPAARQSWEAMCGKMGDDDHRLTAADFDRIAALVSTSRTINLTPGQFTIAQLNEVLKITASIEELKSVSGTTRPLGVPSSTVRWWLEAADVYVRGGRLQLAAMESVKRRKWDQALQMTDEALAFVQPAAERFGSPELCFMMAGFHLLRSTALSFQGKPVEMMAEARLAEKWAARGAQASDMFPGGTQSFECKSAVALINGTLACEQAGALRDRSAEAKRDAAVAEMARAGPQYRRMRAVALDVLARLLDSPTRRRIAGVVATGDPTDPLAWLTVALEEWEARSAATALDALDRAERVRDTKDEALKKTIQEQRELIVREMIAQNYPSITAVTGPAVLLGTPSGRSIARSRYQP